MVIKIVNDGMVMVRKFHMISKRGKTFSLLLKGAEKRFAMSLNVGNGNFPSP